MLEQRLQFEGSLDAGTREAVEMVKVPYASDNAVDTVQVHPCSGIGHLGGASGVGPRKEERWADFLSTAQIGGPVDKRFRAPRLARRTTEGGMGCD